MPCNLVKQGFAPCNNLVEGSGGLGTPCELGLFRVGNEVYRLVYDIVLSRPEDYLSIYQSCCNHKCAMCHSWYFTQFARGSWYSPKDILNEVIRYSELITVKEPRDRATMWHASDICAHCGYCKLIGKEGPYCPKILSKDKVILSPQGWGPARNIVSFTGGDLYCQPDFYVRSFKLIKKEVPDIWIHIETNGYGLTPKNLEALYEAGLDSIWLDMKAYSRDTYYVLCGTTNEWVLKLPELIVDVDIVLEVVLLYIPGMVELKEIEGFAELLANVRKDIPVMLLAFFPEYRLRNAREPTYDEMVSAFKILKNYGLSRVKLGNVSVFCKDRACVDKLISTIGRDSVAL